MAGFEVEALSAAAPPFSRRGGRARSSTAARASAGRQAAGLPGRRRRRRAAADRLRRAECARRAADRARDGRRDAAGRRRDQGREAARRRVGRHALLGARTGALPRVTRASSNCRPMRRWAQDLRDFLDLDDTILELNVTPNRGDAMSVHRAGARSRGAHRAPADRARGDCGAAGTGRAIPGARRRRRGLPAVPRPLHRRPRQHAPVADLDAGAAAPLRRARDQPGRRRHQLRAARARAADARLRSRAPRRRASTCAMRNEGEPLQLLDGREVELASDVLVIADDGRAGRPCRHHGRRAHGRAAGDAREVFLEVGVLRARGDRRPRATLRPARPMRASASSAAWTRHRQRARSSAPRSCCSRSRAARRAPVVATEQPGAAAGARAGAAAARARAAPARHGAG